MEKINSLITYLFSRNPIGEFNYYNELFICSIIIIALALGFQYFYRLRKKEDFSFKKYFKNVGRNLLIFGFLLLFYTAVRYENIPYFSMRVWLYLWLALALWQIVKYVQIFRTTYLPERNFHEKEKLNAPEKEKVKKYSASKKRA